mgnify:CR=1 FL=1
MKKILDRVTGRVYSGRQEAADAIGVAVSSLGRYIRGQIRTQKGRFDEIKEPKEPGQISKRGLNTNLRNPHPNQVRYSLCTVCQNCHCSWVQKFQPVEGWRATENPANESYHVVECPEYQGREEGSHAKRLI